MCRGHMILTPSLSAGVHCSWAPKCVEVRGLASVCTQICPNPTMYPSHVAFVRNLCVCVHRQSHTFPHCLSLPHVSVHILSHCRKRTYVFDTHSKNHPPFTQGLPRTCLLNLLLLCGLGAVGGTGCDFGAQGFAFLFFQF